ncbi:hypothetical protein FEM33_10265 [Dyadobacter flavalbus]|uniref:Glycosyltransferase RgtA/B/C/D-like domain-containing protein n=1 Tax=Dyadobacter flavalbus TaxID=2579942 RepID=A0A5M8QUA2_9BACT|nr:hypothetical protein [Dyadobacter flavalbus]KAA6439827.1 hypothetical protein FEM33_10265 [Dyadobacter flavalbus]
MRSTLLFLIYISLVAFGLYHHEMWRDEIQAWNLVHDSASIPDLFHNIRYEGHPVLWFLVLWPFSKFSHDPHIIQVVHFGMAAFVAFLVIYKSPLRFYQQIAVLFSYFLFFEYGLISRNYLIGIALLLGIAVLWKSDRKNSWSIGILIFLLFQSNAFMALIAAAVLLMLMLELFQSRILFRPGNIVSVIFAMAGGLLFLVTIVPPPDNSYAPIWNLHFWPGLAVTTIGKITAGLLPVPEFKTAFWGTRLIENSIVNAMIAVPVVAALLWSLRKNTSVFIFTFTSFGLMLLFLYLKPVGTYRHYGHFSMALLFAYWIYAYRSEQPRMTSFIFNSVFFAQLPIGLFAAFTDWKNPFSNAVHAADYIERNMPENVRIAGAFNYLSTPVAGYLQKEIRFLNDGRFSDYVIWREKYWNYKAIHLSQAELFSRFVETVDVRKSNVLIMNYTRDPYTLNDAAGEGQVQIMKLNGRNYKVTCVKVCAGAIVEDENYYLYTFSEI